MLVRQSLYWNNSHNMMPCLFLKLQQITFFLNIEQIWKFFAKQAPGKIRWWERRCIFCWLCPMSLKFLKKFFVQNQHMQIWLNRIWLGNMNVNIISHVKRRSHFSLYFAISLETFVKKNPICIYQINHWNTGNNAVSELKAYINAGPLFTKR